MRAHILTRARSGWQLGEFSEWEKFTNFELAARVPLMFRVPWLAASTVRIEALVELVDVRGHAHAHIHCYCPLLLCTTPAAVAPCSDCRACISPQLEGCLLTALPHRCARDLLLLLLLFSAVLQVMPTLAELAKLQMPATEPIPLDGISLVPLMKHQAAIDAATAAAGSGGGGGASSTAAAAAAAARSAPAPAGRQQALTQFPRCLKVWGHGVPRNQSLPEWEFNDCDNVQRSDFTHMGLSIRTQRWRFTRWYPWNGSSLRPLWDSPYATANTELYDHDGDDGCQFGGQHEAQNLAAEPSMGATVAQLGAQLESAFGRGRDHNREGP